MPRFPLALLLVALLAVIAGCSSESSGQPSGDPTSQAEAGNHPTPEIRSDGAYVYEIDGIEYPFPSVLTFDDGAWVREDIVWIDGDLLGHQYAHTQRPRKMLYNITHDQDGFTVRFQEGKRVEGDWFPDGKGRVELPGGSSQEFTFIEGIEHGMWKSFGPDGQLTLEVMMTNGEKNGKFVMYQPNGLVQAIGTAKGDDFEIEETFDQNGNRMPTKEDLDAWLERQ